MIDTLSRDIQLACVWEATARKAGNVHCLARFADLQFTDFVLGATAVGPVMSRLRQAPLGQTILQALTATRTVIKTNANLGIVLLLAPLSKCEPGNWEEQLQAVLSTSTIEDARHTYQAIRLAVPGGLARVESQDVADEPTETLGEVMHRAADRDMIARQYTNGFEEVLDFGIPKLMEGWQHFGCVEAAILHAQVAWLATYPDSLIQRKLGASAASKVMERAREIDLRTECGLAQYAEFDRWLRRDGNAYNPGTTADLLTACLFITLREHRMELNLPFTWGIPWPSASLSA